MLSVKEREREREATFFDLLESFVERLLVLGFEKLSAIMKEALSGEGNGDDDCAKGGHNPRRSELQSCSLFSSATHSLSNLSVDESFETGLEERV